METVLRRMDVREAPELGQFAEACSREDFGALFELEAMDRLCTKVFAHPVPEQLLRCEVRLVQQGADWQRYVALGSMPCPMRDLSHPLIELARVYVPARWQEQGVADQLMGRFPAEAAIRGGHGVWLQAYECKPSRPGLPPALGLRRLPLLPRPLRRVGPAPPRPGRNL